MLSRSKSSYNYSITPKDKVCAMAPFMVIFDKSRRTLGWKIESSIMNSILHVSNQSTYLKLVIANWLTCLRNFWVTELSYWTQSCSYCVKGWHHTWRCRFKSKSLLINSTYTLIKYLLNNSLCYSLAEVSLNLDHNGLYYQKSQKRLLQYHSSSYKSVLVSGIRD